MSRPRDSSGEYGRTPVTCSTVVSMVNSGMISTRPPTAITSTVNTMNRNAFRSRVSCRMNIALFSHRNGGQPHHRFAHRAVSGPDQVVDHDQRTSQEAQAAGQPDHVERMHRADRFGERVLQEAELVIE